MWKSKAREVVCARSDAQAQDRLLRHYRKIAAPAVAAALDAGTQRAPAEQAEKAETRICVPTFLRPDDHAA